MIFLFLTIIFVGSCLYYGSKACIDFTFFGNNLPSKSNIDEILEFTEDEDEKKDIQTVIIKDNNIDVSRIKEYEGTERKKFEFRPQNFAQFIGQEEAKERAKTIIKKTQKQMRAHFLVDGIKGHGKTTFVNLIAKQLGAKLIERIGKQINEDNIVDIINEINNSEEKNVMFFIDEIDSMDWKVLKILNPIIEQYQINGKKIKPFIFVGATINKHLLIKNNPDTLDRIPTHIKFTRYNAEEIKKITTQYQHELYPLEAVEGKAIDIISKNCKFNPRTAIAFLEEYIVEQNINKILRNSKIIKNGLTKLDIEILQTLLIIKRPMGANALAQKCKLSQNEYVREFEPFLVEYGYIARVPSRVITDKGRKFLEEIK